MSKQEKTFTEKMRENPWILSTILLFLTCLFIIASNLGNEEEVISYGDYNIPVKFLNEYFKENPNETEIKFCPIGGEGECLLLKKLK